MSIKSESIATCSRCGARTGLTIYKSINTSEDPALKEKVKDGSIFLWQCPSCGSKGLPSPCLLRAALIGALMAAALLRARSRRNLELL